MIKPKKLKNGMRVHLVPFSGTEAMTALVLVKVGSRYEPAKVWGGSHFIEHLMFKGTKRRPSTIDISRELDRYGAAYNAYTGKDLTGYYIKIDADKAPIAIDMLNDMIFHSTYDPTEFRREKKVIIEEIKMYEENPIMNIGNLVEEALYGDTTLGMNIAGTAETMTRMKRNDIIAYRDAYYTPERTVVVLAGKVPKNAMELLEKSFGKVKARAEEGTGYTPLESIQEHDEPRVKIQEKPLSQIQIALAFASVGRSHKDMPAIKLMAKILGGAMSSRLFIELRERRGLCYSVRASADTYEDIGAVSIEAGLDHERLELAMKTLFNELKKLKKDGVTAKELRYAKDQVRGGMKLALENSSNRAEYYGRQELYDGEVKSLDARMDEFEKVTRAQIKRVANEIFTSKRLAIAAIGPYKSKEALLKKFPKFD